MDEDFVPGPHTQKPAKASTISTAAYRQRGWRRVKFQKLLCFCIFRLLPETIVFNIQDAEPVPKLEPGNRVSPEGRLPVAFYGRTGGVVPSAEELLDILLRRLEVTEHA